jgi:nucleoside-diphosphate-sugar epimerase
MRRRGALSFLAGVTFAPALKACTTAPAARNQSGVVLIAGATGMIGRDIAVKVKEAGLSVRGMTRNIEKAKREISPAYEWVSGDVRDPATLARAMSGVDYVISTINGDTRTGPFSPEFIDFAGNRNLIDAAKAANVKHFVLISSATSGPQVDQSLNPASGYVRYFKTKAEAYLRASGQSHTIVAPGRLKYEPGGTVGIRLLARKDYEISRTTSGDIGLVVVDTLTNPAARSKAFALKNDETLKPGAWKAMYAAMPNE